MTSADAVLRARIDLPTTAGSVPVARRLVAQLLQAWSAQTRHEESMLLLSELVTNVVRHVTPATTFTIELILSALKLRVAVVDASAAPRHGRLRPSRTRSVRRPRGWASWTRGRCGASHVVASRLGCAPCAGRGGRTRTARGWRPRGHRGTPGPRGDRPGRASDPGLWVPILRAC